MPREPALIEEAPNPNHLDKAEYLALARATARSVAKANDAPRATVTFPDEKTIEAIRLCARLEGVLTDPVYEGKSMAALVDLVRSGRIAPGSQVLYAHLGGQPALNAYAGVF